MAFSMESMLEDISGRGREYQRSSGNIGGRTRPGRFTRTTRDRSPGFAGFKVIKGSGHLIPIDQPVQLAKEIASFTTRLAG